MTENTWAFVSKCLRSMQKQSDRLNKATNQLLIAPESPLVEPLGVMEDNLLQALSLLIKDDFESLSWFVYECDYGRDPRKAGRKDDMRLIDSYDKLRWLIEINL